MQAFVRRGFQLRSASLETRLAYTCFLLLMVPAAGTVVALSVGRVGFDPHAVATYYRGGENEMSFPKTFWQLMEVSHFHLFTVPVVVLIVSHLLYGTPFSRRVRMGLTSVTFGGALLDALGPWAVRYGAAGMAYVLLLGWVLLGGGLALTVLLTLTAMWAPRHWLEREEPAPQPDQGDDSR